MIVWSDRAAGGEEEDYASRARRVNEEESKADKIAKTIERIRNSRLEMESNRHGIIIDPITLDNNEHNSSGGGAGVKRIGEPASQTVCLRNTSQMDVHCIIKDQVARQRGFRVKGPTDFVLHAQSSEAINVSFTPRRFGIEKSIIVFEFTSEDEEEYNDDYSEDEIYYVSTVVKQFTITRYITIRSGDPDDYDIIKPTAPYVKKQPQRGDGNKFVNPVRASSAGRSTNNGSMVPFRFKLGKYPIPSALFQQGVRKDAVNTFMHQIYGGQRGGERDEDVDYSSLLTDENYSNCMRYLLWFEELQMKKDITTYDFENALIRRDGRRYYTCSTDS